jgi:quinohemoprotein ethanol dehydrogenase
VYKLGGAAQLPPVPARLILPIAPPPATASADVVGRGAGLYGTFCGSCHGAGVIGVGILPDLRRTPMIQSEQAFEQVVLGGDRKAHGMASFASVMSAEDVSAIRAFVILRANQDKPAAAP